MPIMQSGLHLHPNLNMVFPSFCCSRHLRFIQILKFSNEKQKRRRSIQKMQKRKEKKKKRIEMVWRAVAVAANPFMIISQECRPLIKQVPIQA